MLSCSTLALTPAAYDLLNGPSGKGVQDLFTPEINSAYLGSTNGSEWTTNALWTQQYDALHVNAALQWITGRTWTGNPASVPTLFGFNFQVGAAHTAGWLRLVPDIMSLAVDSAKSCRVCTWCGSNMSQLFIRLDLSW